MTTSIPSSFNPEDLQKMLDSAPTEDRDMSIDENGNSQADYENAAEAGLDRIDEMCPGPLGHKVAMMMIVKRMFAWHNHMAEMQIEDGEIQSAMNWARDAGEFQVIHNILTNISVASYDFTCPDHSCEEKD
jgi:hypothetical protein